MGGCHDLHHALLAHRRDRAHVAGQHRLERLLRLPFRMLAGQALHLGDGEGELGVDRLLDPERAVIVEGGDAILWGHVVGAALLASPR